MTLVTPKIRSFQSGGRLVYATLLNLARLNREQNLFHVCIFIVELTLLLIFYQYLYSRIQIQTNLPSCDMGIGCTHRALFTVQETSYFCSHLLNCRGVKKFWYYFSCSCAVGGDTLDVSLEQRTSLKWHFSIESVHSEDMEKKYLLFFLLRQKQRR